MILIKISEGHFVDLDKLVFKFMKGCRGTRIAKSILKKKNLVGRLVVLDF